MTTTNQSELRVRLTRRKTIELVLADGTILPFTFNPDESIPAGLFIKYLVPQRQQPDPSTKEDRAFAPYGTNLALLRRAQMADGLAMAAVWMQENKVTKLPPRRAAPTPPPASIADLAKGLDL